MTIALSTIGFQIAFAGKIAPGTYMNNTLVEWQSAGEVQEDFSRALDTFEKAPLVFNYNGVSYEFAMAELGVELLKTESVEAIPVIRVTETPWSMSGGFFKEKEVGAQFNFDDETLLRTLDERIPELNQAAQNPGLEWDDANAQFTVTPEESGWEVNQRALTEQLTARMTQLSLSPIELSVLGVEPTLTAADVEAVKDEMSKKITTESTLAAEGQSWTINWLDQLKLLSFEPVNQLGKTKINIALNDEFFGDYVAEEIAPALDVASEDVTIHYEENGAIWFEGSAVDGLEVEQKNLKRLVEIALNKGISGVEIPLRRTPGKVIAPPALKALGITELVSVGHSGYAGSPYNRQHNIRVAIGAFDGVLVAPGETFSFLKQLGPVDGSTGYAKELVIKEGETIPEYGGGVCQVSSTLFRAAVFGGFPIVQRHPHSYAVSYYSWPLGWGLDAAVYIPGVDLKFTNDTNHHILIQAYQEGVQAFYKFYGTKDGREVVMDGPYISNRRGAPPPVITYTDELAPGQRVKKDSAHNGFTATWHRTVTYPDGRIEEKSFVSPYKPWAEKWLVGEESEEPQQE